MEETTRRFIEYIRIARNSAENTISAYRIDLDQFHEYLSSHETPALTPTSYSPERVTQYIDWLENRSYSPATVARKVAVLRTYFEYLSFEYGESTEAIVAVLQGPSGTRHAPRILNADEMNALLRAPARMRKPRSTVGMGFR